MATGTSNLRGMIRRCLTPAAWLALVGCLCAAMAHPSTDDLHAQEDVLSAEQRQWLADQNTAIRIGVTTIPPQVFVDSRTGQLVGLCIDFIQEMERILGYRFEVVFFDTWNAMMEAAFLRDIDVVYAAQRTPSREAAFLFTDSYLIFENKIVTTIDIDGPLTMADLKDKTVTVVRGAAIEEHLKLNYPAIQLMPADDELIGLTRVSFNQAEAMVVEIARASWYIQQKKFTNLHIAGDTGYIYELGFACRSDWPELRDLLNAGLRSIPPARQAELTHRWILPTGRDEPNVWIWLAVAGGLAAALLAVFGWNRLLSLQVRQRTAELEQELDAHEKDLAALRRYETSMQRLFGNLRGIAYRCRYERDWPMEFISAGCEEMTGYSDQAYYDGTASWGDLILEEDRDYAWDEISKGLEKNEAFQVEYRIRDRSGQIKWFWEKGCGVYDPTGQVISLEGFITDITDRKQAEEAYRESEEHLRSLFVASPVGIGLVKDRILLSVNERICKMTGYTSDELIGQNSRMLYPTEEEYRYVGAEKYRQIELCGIGTVETRWRRKDGTFIDVLLSSAPLDQEHRDKGTTFTAMDITDRKAAEKALQDSEYRYRELIDLAVDGILLGDHDGHILEANSFMLTLTGKPRDDLVGRHIAVLFEPEVLKQTPLRFDLLQRGHVVVSERAIRRTDGVTTLVEMRTKMMPDGSYQSILRDITERKRVENALRESEEQYRTLVDQAAEMLFLHDMDGRLIDVNQAAISGTGYSRDELLRMRVYDIDPDADSRQDKRQIWDSLSNGDPAAFEVRHRRKDGTFYWAQVRAGKLLLRGQTYILALVSDITDRKEAEQTAALNSRRTRSLLQLNQMTDATISQIADFALEEAILLTGSTIGYLAFLNEDESVLKMFSWSKSAMADCAINEKPLTFLVRDTGLWGEAVRQRRPIITNDYASENPWKKGVPAGHGELKRHMNVPIFSGDRMVLVAGVGNKELPYEQEDIQQLTLFMEGLWRLVERKNSEQVRDNLLKELRHKNEELESIVFIASHDLRGPLVNIRGFAGELNKSIEQIQEVVTHAGLNDDVLTKLAMPLERDIPESLQFIDASSQKMEMLLNGLLRLSRIGTAQINPTAINMEQLIGGIIGGLEFKIRQSNIDIAVEGSVPPCRGDLTLINQVFSNLVDNAIKYRHPERPCRIRIRGRAENGRSLYEVEDNGIGIAAEHQKKIFDIFYQLKPGSGGDGLGLTIVRRVLERQNGTFEIVSEVGAGTTVRIALPSE